MKRRILSMALIFAVAVGLLSGCSGDAKESGKGSEGASQTMGRYLEEEVPMPEGVKTIIGIGTLEDGTLRMVGGTDSKTSVYDSADNGGTWEQVCEISPQEQDYINSVSLSPAGDIGMVVLRSTESGTVEYIPCLADEQGNVREVAVNLPGGSQQESEKESESVQEESGQQTAAASAQASAASEAGTASVMDQNWLMSLKFAQDGTMYGVDMEQNIYRIDKETGEIQKTYTFGSWVNDFVVFGDRMLVVMDGKTEYYDLETGESMGEDQNMTEQLGSSLDGYMVSGIAPVLFLQDGEDALYFCNDQGLYRHVMEGSVSEQIIDGSLNSLANPSIGLIGMGALEDGSFVVGVLQEEQYKLLRYVYSKDTPSRPSTEVKVYSLRDHTELRQAISMYQKENPDVFVSLEIGVTGEDGVTASDALRTLNTNIAAGKGPDILVLDGMPVDSYIEKGLLTDLSDLTKAIAQEDGLYENVANAYQTKEGLFAVPSRFSIPSIQADQTVLEQIDSLTSLAEQAKKLREDDADVPNIINTQDAEELIHTLYYLDSATWETKDGEFDEEKIAQFYESVKQIYDLDAHDEEQGSVGTYVYAVGGAGAGSAMQDLGLGAIEYFYGSLRMNLGALSDMNSFSTVTSVNQSKEGSTYKTFTSGESHIFIPSQVLGICSNSQNAQAARDFVKYVLSSEAQAVNQGGGFPVNRAGFAKSLENKSGVENTEMAVSNEEGDMIFLSLSWPDEAQIADLQESMEKLDTPLTADEVIVEAVTEQGTACLEGSVTPQEAAANALQKINLYLAE